MFNELNITRTIIPQQNGKIHIYTKHKSHQMSLRSPLTKTHNPSASNHNLTKVAYDLRGRMVVIDYHVSIMTLDNIGRAAEDHLLIGNL